MILLAVPVIAVVASVGKVIYDRCAVESVLPVKYRLPAPRTVLSRNFERLSRELSAHAGPKVAVLGQPGAGKSSILVKMCKGEIEPRPLIGTKTDATNWADDEAWPLLSFHRRFAFVDVPGYDTEAHPTIAVADDFPFDSVDVYVFVVAGKIHASDLEIFSRIIRTGKPTCIARSFSDSLDKDEKLQISRDVRSHLTPNTNSPMFFFSNRTGRGVQPVLEWIRWQFAD